MDPTTETIFQYLPAEMQAKPELAGYKDVKAIDLLNQHAELSGKVKVAGETQAAYEARLAKAVEPLPENATPEQQAAHQAKVRALNGVPEKFSDYKVQLPESVKPDDPLLVAYSTEAHKTGMSPAQLQAGINSFINYVTEAETKAVKAAEDALKISWGPQYEANAKTAQLALKAIFKEAGVPDSEVATLIPVLNRSAGFAQAMFKIARHYSEAQLQGIGGGGSGAAESSKLANALIGKI
jgi:hypothetical protein